jgi:hypothetical protein
MITSDLRSCHWQPGILAAKGARHTIPGLDASDFSVPGGAQP